MYIACYYPSWVVIFYHLLSDKGPSRDDVTTWNCFRITGPLWSKPPVTSGFPSQRPVSRSGWPISLSMFVRILHTHTHTYIYIYIYIFIVLYYHVKRKAMLVWISSESCIRKTRPILFPDSRANSTSWRLCQFDQSLEALWIFYMF